ncbi:GAF domain-containing sensor histidine kinase [Candidatus Promineifilum breve]|uniref:GAF domain-containing sensor histidine kinase n=1 Tax=Candidatus Promineifilum breve TaxID=1806508 RepID=UPI001E4FAC7A|nr:GAF domain-containing sensor histidine kinase [Candidatus Promineifilum breve]
MILDQLREILEYTHGVVFTLEGWDLVAQAVSGKQQLDETLPFRVRVGGMETLTALVNERRPQRTADVWGADPVARFLRLLLAEQAAGLLEGVHSWMWVPLATKGRVIGGVGVARVQPNYFTAHHADLALMLANQATIALVNTQQYQQGQVLASLEERRRLAQNLHDAVNQSLFSASLIAEVLPRLWEQHPKEVRESLEDLRRLTRGALAEMRGLLVDLRPLELSESELSELLPLLGDAFSGRTNVPVTVTVGEIGALPGEVQVALYRLCQEALNNVAKHAAATRVAIDLRHEAGIVELRICDDGRGFDTNQIYSGHYGLGMMRERAAAIGATVSITSRSGEGTEITTRWPSAAHGEAP